MKSMKRIVALVFAVVMVISLAACGKSDEESLIGKWKMDMEHYYDLARANGVTEEEIQEARNMEITIIDEFTEDGEWIRITTRKNVNDDYDMEDMNYRIVDGRIEVSEHGEVEGFMDFKISGKTLELTQEGVTLRFTRVK